MPSRSSRKYSLRKVMPPSLKLPCGAHFQVPSAMYSVVSPLKPSSASCGARLQHRHARQPFVFAAGIAADMREQRARADPVVLRAAAGEVLAAEHFAAEFEEQRRRRDPAQLHAVVAVLVAEESLVGQRPVEEIVGVGVVAVEVADVGKEAARRAG